MIEEFITKHLATTFEATAKVYELLGAEINLHYDIADTTCTAGSFQSTYNSLVR